jgi:hypothetical protein
MADKHKLMRFRQRLTERRSIARNTALGLRHIFASTVAPAKTSPTRGTIAVMRGDTTENKT